MTEEFQTRINWAQLLDELKEAGYSGYYVAKSLGKNWDTVQGWREHEPRHCDGEALKALHAREMAKPRSIPEKTGTAYSQLSEEARMKSNARAHANVYKRRGLIEKQPCEDCGNPDAEMHHDDYAKPTLVRWKCRACHLRFHKEDQT